MNKKWILVLFLCVIYNVQANLFIKQQDMTISGALTAIAKDLQLKLVDELSDNTGRQILTQNLSGQAINLLSELSEIYGFDWYFYGGTLTVQSEQPYVNFVYRPKNIDSKTLLNELNSTFKRNPSTKIKLVERGNSILFSGTKGFVNEAANFAATADSNQFLETGNNLQIKRIEFHFLSVLNREVKTYDGTVTFPGAQSIISSVITNIGQFQNLSDDEALTKAYTVKLSDGDKQQLEEEEKTSNVQALPGSNAILVRGTPEEVKLAQRIAALIDERRPQLLFSLKVYDVAVDRSNTIGIDSSWVNGSKGVYDIVIPPFDSTRNFLKNLQALSSNGVSRGIYETNLLILSNQQGHFGKKQVATITIVSEKQVDTQKIEADNSLYVTGRLLPSGSVQAKVDYIEESLDNESDVGGFRQPPKVNSQSLNSEVYIQPEQTVILGGFDTTETQQSVTGVPVLSSIPIVGHLFKNTVDVRRKYKRYISISFQVVE